MLSSVERGRFGVGKTTELKCTGDSRKLRRVSKMKSR